MSVPHRIILIPTALMVVAMALVLATGCASPPKNYVVLLANENGATGAVAVQNEAGAVVLDQAGYATGIDDVRKPPGEPFIIEAQQIRRDFGPALAATPQLPVSFLLYFEMGTAELTQASRQEIPGIIDTITGRKFPRVAIIGHTDRIADNQANYEIALSRANKIRTLLAESGIDPADIEVSSHGETNPLVETADDVAEPKNRRVEVTVR